MFFFLRAGGAEESCQRDGSWEKKREFPRTLAGLATNIVNQYMIALSDDCLV